MLRMLGKEIFIHYIQRYYRIETFIAIFNVITRTINQTANNRTLTYNTLIHWNTATIKKSKIDLHGLIQNPNIYYEMKNAK